MILNTNDISDQNRTFPLAEGAEPFTLSVERGAAQAYIRIAGNYSHVFGLGERFDSLDQAGQTTDICVEEKFTNQGKKTYMPVPFFFTDTGLGIYIDTKRIHKIIFEEVIAIELPYEKDEILPVIHYFSGTPGEILTKMASLLGVSPLPPRWAFGPWISANRWDRQTLVESQTEIALAQHFPASVLVIEAWSDESTFYLWNDAGYSEASGEEPLSGEDLTFSEDGRWPSPADMIAKLHDNGIRLILWQVPVLKKLEPGRACLQHERDIAYAVKNNLVVQNSDGTPYVIPKGHWFAGSFVPDFTNPKARDWWFSKRRYLEEMGVDGFKTDGGEFIYDESVRFFDGRTGKEMINDYPALYTEAYTENNGPDQTLFSRAGYTSSRKTPIHWAGDQVSTWEEMQHVFTAGLSAGLSGISYWSFDIAGFAGPMPDPRLYSRCVQWSVFAPVMQWHSEPIGGQFAEIMASGEKVNERSPWNIADYYGRPELVDQLRFHFALRMNLLPSIYSFAVESAVTGFPMMKPLMIDYPADRVAYKVDDEYIFGSLLIAPVLFAKAEERRVYLPEGTWRNLWTGEVLSGLQSITAVSGEERIPVYIRSGKALLVDLDKGQAPGRWDKNGRADELPQEEKLYLALAGTCGADKFYLDTDRSTNITWDEEKITVKISGKLDSPVVQNGTLPSDGQPLTHTMMIKDLVPFMQDTLGIPIYPITRFK